MNGSHGFKAVINQTAANVPFTGIANLSIDTQQGQDAVTVHDIAYANSAEDLVNFQIDLGQSVVNVNSANKSVLLIDQFTDSYVFDTANPTLTLNEPLHAATDETTLSSNIVTDTFAPTFTETLNGQPTDSLDSFKMRLTEQFSLNPNTDTAVLQLKNTPGTIQSVTVGGTVLPTSEYQVSVQDKSVTLHLNSAVTSTTAVTVVYQRQSRFKLTYLPVSASNVVLLRAGGTAYATNGIPWIRRRES